MENPIKMHAFGVPLYNLSSTNRTLAAAQTPRPPAAAHASSWKSPPESGAGSSCAGEEDSNGKLWNNVTKAIVNHPQMFPINGWYKPSKHGWFILGLLTLGSWFCPVVAIAGPKLSQKKKQLPKIVAVWSRKSFNVHGRDWIRVNSLTI